MVAVGSPLSPPNQSQSGELSLRINTASALVSESSQNCAEENHSTNCYHYNLKTNSKWINEQINCTKDATSNSEQPPNFKATTTTTATESKGESANGAAGAQNQLRDKSNAEASALDKSPFQQQQQPHKANVIDKLKRGLTNFLNNYNPAPYFVPKSAQLAGAKSSPSTPTIINDGPTADAVIKGPNRLVQARPLGGPLRWGR